MRSCEVKTTFENVEDARRFAEFLLDKKLIACGQIGEIESHYSWQNKREITQEFLLVMKTRKTLLGTLKNEILKFHPYDLPEIVVTKIFPSKDYGKWIEENTK